VVVYLRPWGAARSLANDTAVVEELTRLFGDSRVFQLRRNLPLPEGTILYVPACYYCTPCPEESIMYCFLHPAFWWNVIIRCKA